ncbi:hypothetical protein BDK51DRAFT_39736 [Blyttiomyces helicus]|uniref:Fe2OG dioxygenase domain-containing protein n=1 Tax=Blyttiomyces helicus TaxID=388810 RepID=A0A4P9W476_9FUNG|nr:hypothetical protein BDK51DRAFT_39736 [Blyttiomyces helicus]|eukprot:RKO86984.1 hypothetical protein BDK51DRAFT_39736 [Blyttiomyces helicus]
METPTPTASPELSPSTSPFLPHTLSERIFSLKLADLPTDLPTDADYPFPDLEDQEEEEFVDEVSEQEMLAMLDAQEDPLLVARRLRRADAGADQLVDELFEVGFVVVDGFVEAQVAEEAKVEALKMFRRGEMTPACEIRLEDDPFRDRNARNDSIRWLHPDSAPAAFAPIVAKLEELQTRLGKTIHMNGTAEFQLACYEGNGGRYERHRDAFPNDDPTDTEQRRITAICYTGPSTWTPADGGELRIHGRAGAPNVDIEPRGGRLLLFLSGVIDHEVMPAKTDRVAVTAWMK